MMVVIIMGFHQVRKSVKENIAEETTQSKTQKHVNKLISRSFSDEHIHEIDEKYWHD